MTTTMIKSAVPLPTPKFSDVQLNAFALGQEKLVIAGQSISLKLTVGEYRAYMDAKIAQYLTIGNDMTAALSNLWFYYCASNLIPNVTVHTKRTKARVALDMTTSNFELNISGIERVKQLWKETCDHIPDTNAVSVSGTVARVFGHHLAARMLAIATDDKYRIVP